MTDQLITTLVAVDDETVFAGTMEVVFSAQRWCNSWMEANTGIMSTSVVDLEVLGDRIYAFTLAGSRLLYSENGGRIVGSQEVPPKKQIDFSYSRISALNGKLYVGATRFDPNNVVGGIFQLDEQNNTLIEIKTT